MKFEDRIDSYLERIENVLDEALPGPSVKPQKLHAAMRYSVLGGGKRIRPLLVYATGEALGVPVDMLDAPAAAIEMMHAFSLVHDDLPAMDDDDLRRGRPTTHRAFDEATAILAADALQPLAFMTLASAPALRDYPAEKIRIIDLIARCCGSEGMTGGQAIDIGAEGQNLDVAELEHMYRLKTGRLLRASVMSAAYCPPERSTTELHGLERFVDYMGLAFQIRDDILDIEGTTEEIGKQQGADIAHDKATYPSLLGMDEARRRSDELLKMALAELDSLNCDTEGLDYLAHMIVLRRT
ncbi:MAG: polyprenyl synthetase family protein [Gammaproteobacteria bacterium]